jgi:membrane-bound inhibitor of C-type lysozyme
MLPEYYGIVKMPDFGDCMVFHPWIMTIGAVMLTLFKLYKNGLCYRKNKEIHYNENDKGLKIRIIEEIENLQFVIDNNQMIFNNYTAGYSWFV